MSTSCTINHPSVRIAALCFYCVVDMSVVPNTLGAPRTRPVLSSAGPVVTFQPTYFLSCPAARDVFLKYFKVGMRDSQSFIRLSAWTREFTPCGLFPLQCALLLPLWLDGFVSGPRDISCNLHLFISTTSVISFLMSCDDTSDDVMLLSHLLQMAETLGLTPPCVPLSCV